MSQSYPYTKASVNSDKLTLEILANETIVKTLEKIEWTSPDSLSITFDLALETAEETALDTIVSGHDGNPPTEYDYFCYCCGLNYSEGALSKPTQCQCCSSIDIQDQYHKSNLIATTDPTATDDDTEGYCVGSPWINITTDSVFKCVDNTTDTAIWKRISVSEHDYVQEFLYKPTQLFAQIAMPIMPGASTWLYDDYLLFGSPALANVSTMGKLRYDLAIAASCVHDLIKYINPADHTYFEVRWKEQSEDAGDIRMYHAITDLELWANYVALYWKNATTLTVECNSPSANVTQDIVTDITVEQEFCVRIKSGAIEFLIDDVVKKTFTGSEIFYDVPVGLGVELYWNNGGSSAARWFTLNYLKTHVGRAF